MSAFVNSTAARIDKVINQARAFGTLDEYDLSAITSMREVAELARWILAHAHEDGGHVRLQITMNNPNNLPVEQLFLNAARHNEL